LQTAITGMIGHFVGGMATPQSGSKLSDKIPG